jgi:hypothetical protein
MFSHCFSSGKYLDQWGIHLMPLGRSVRFTAMVGFFCSLNLQNVKWAERPFSYWGYYAWRMPLWRQLWVKFLWKRRNFTSLGKLYDMMAFWTYFCYLPVLVSTFLHIETDWPCNGMDQQSKVFCLPNDRLLKSGLRNALYKWKNAGYSLYKIRLTSTKKLERK